MVGKDVDFINELSNHNLIKLCDISFLSGEDNHKTVVRIKAINYLTEEKASHPYGSASMLQTKLNQMNLSEEYYILLFHRSETFEAYVMEHIDLVLSGHAHGG